MMSKGFISAVLVLICVLEVSVIACPASIECQCFSQMLICVQSNFTEIPDDIPADIRQLNFIAGELQAIEADKIGRLLQLQELTMDENQIYEVENGTFDRLLELQRISLNENKISYLMPGIFANLQKLQYLLLSGNSLTSIEGLFTGLHQLTNLNLNNNRIQTISSNTFNNLRNLYDLQLNNNNIKSIPLDTFRQTPALMVLGLGSNPISSLDNTFNMNYHLHYINLTGCAFTRFPGKLSASLKYIKLSKNNINSLFQNETERYYNLETLIMEENGLQYVEKDAFARMENLTDLFLFVNNLTQMPGKFPYRIRNIDLDSNQITSIPMDTFTDHTELYMLSLRSNKIITFNRNSFMRVTRVKTLRLDGNPLRILHDNIFMLVSRLEHLTLNRLNIHEIYPNFLLNLDHLQSLEMARVTMDNEQGFLGNFLIHVPTLKSLDLARSPEIAQYFLSHVTIMESVANLTHLNLADNGLTTLPPVMPWHLPYLLKLHLSGNPFNCTEVNLWLQEWYMMEPKIFLDFDQVFCHSPPHLKGQLLRDANLANYDLGHWNDSISTVVNHYDYSDYIDSITYPNYDDYYDDYDDYDYREFNYDNYDFITLTTVVMTEQASKITTTLEQVTDDPNKVSGTVTTTLEQVTDDPNKVSGTTPKPQEKKKTVGFRSTAITIGSAFGVIMIMMLIAGVTYCICLRRNRNVLHNNTPQNNGANDYVFIVSKTEIKNETETPAPRKLTREERGSTTSKASQDITNDTSLKVYTLD